MHQPLLPAIPQVEDDNLSCDERLDWTSFPRFTSKVHDGSEKAIYVVRYAFRAFLEAVTGEQGWDDPFSDECIAAMVNAIPEKPFRSAAEFLEALREAGHLDALEGENPASRDGRRKKIRAATEACITEWCGRDFVERCDRVMWNSHYDDNDAIASVLYILAAWPVSPV
jgi:hypothetical protein